MVRTELVNDMKVDAEVRPDCILHNTSQPDYTQGATGRWRPKRETWKRGEVLGAGSFGTVWVERCLSSEGPPRLRAVKMIKKLPDPSHETYCDQELEAIAKFSQQKYSGLFVRSIGWFENQESIFIAMEYIELGDLQSHLSGPLPEVEAQQICYQLLRGLQCLHDNQFVHRDLKPQNVFVKFQGPKWWVKIGDFGFSKRCNQSAALQSRVGTELYLAPEVRGVYPPGSNRKRLRHYTTRVDMWSLGVMVFYLLCYAYPFPDDDSLSAYVRTSHSPSLDITQPITRESHRFLKRLLAADPTVRCSAEEGLQDEWFKQSSDLVSGLSRMAISEENKAREYLPSAASNMVETTHEASRGWNDRYDSSAIVGEQTIRVAQRPQDKSTVLHPPASTKRASVSGLRDDSQIYHDEGLSFLSQKKYADAKRKLQEAFELRKHTFGINHEDTLTSLGALGDALFGLENYAQAEGVYRDVWERRRITIGKNDAETLRFLDLLGEALSHQSKYTEAEAVYRDAWETRKQTLGEEHRDTLSSLHSQGQTLSSQNRYPEAENMLRDVWERQRRTLGDKHEDTLYCLDSLGNATLFLGKHALAEDMFRRAWKGRKQVLGEDHQDTLVSHSALGDTLSIQGKHVKAEAVHRDVWKRRKRTLGEEDEETLTSLDWIGDCLDGQNKYAEAEAVYRDVWKIRKRALGEEHEDTLESLYKIGKALYDQEKYAEAESMYREAWRGQKRALMEEHEDTLDSLDALGEALYAQKKYAEAETVFRNAWKGRKRALGEDHKDTLDSREKLDHAILRKALLRKGQPRQESSLASRGSRMWKKWLS